MSNEVITDDRVSSRLDVSLVTLMEEACTWSCSFLYSDRDDSAGRQHIRQKIDLYTPPGSNETHPKPVNKTLRLERENI